MAHSVLLIDDERSFRSITASALESEGYEVVCAASAQEGTDRWQQSPTDFVIIDRRLPDGDGLDLLERLRSDAEERNVDASFLMVTAYADVEHAVEALKRGADDYLTKPVQLADIFIKLRKAAERNVLQRQVRAFRRREPDAVKMLRATRSRAMRQVLEMAESVATSPHTAVLIQGESGSGKDLLARYIHAHTPVRSESSFVELNCASLSEQLAESELFGHERGAFTDAKTARQGLLELADEGTLFLDEVGDLGAGIQAKLLRVLETMRFRRLGSTRDRAVDVRIISATHRDLAVAVQDGLFRLDLYHRLNVFHLEVPPLRERPEDIPHLAREFMRSTAQRIGRAVPELSPEAEATLVEYPFPGNIRELKNVIERAVIIEKTPMLTPRSLVLRPVYERPDTSTDRRFFSVELDRHGQPPSLKDVERAYVERVLAHANNNKTRAAALLGITFPTITKKLSDDND